MPTGPINGSSLTMSGVGGVGSDAGIAAAVTKSPIEIIEEDLPRLLRSGGVTGCTGHCYVVHASPRDRTQLNAPELAMA